MAYRNNKQYYPAPNQAGFYPQPQQFYAQQAQQPFYPYSPQYANQSLNGQYNKAKKSGAKEVKGTTKNGDQYFGVSAWFVRKNVGLVKINAFVNSKSTHFTTQAGRDGVSLMFEVLYQNTGVKRLEIATYFFDSGKAFLKELGIVVSTKARNGGYAGYFSKKRR